MHAGNVLTTVMEKEGRTPAWVATKTGMSTHMVYYYRKRASIDSEVLGLFAEAFGMTLAEFGEAGGW